MSGKNERFSIEEQNRKLKLAGRILLALIFVLLIVLAYNMVELRGLKEIASGDYITVEDCDMKYVDNLFNHGFELEVANGTGID